MKRAFKAAGIIALLLAVYFLAQGFVMFCLIAAKAASMGFFSARPGAVAPEELLKSAAENAPLMILGAVALSAPTYWLIYRERKRELLEFLSLKGIGAVGAVVLLLFGVSLNVVVELILALLGKIGGLSRFFESYEQVERIISAGSFPLRLAAVGIVGPLFEEALFRGLVFGELRKIMRAGPALVLQAIIFGAYHLNAVQGTYAFLIGLVLGWLYCRSGSIVSPALVHVAVNASTVFFTEFAPSGLPGWAGDAVAVAGVALFFLSGAYIMTARSFRRGLGGAACPPRREAGGGDGAGEQAK